MEHGWYHSLELTNLEMACTLKLANFLDMLAIFKGKVKEKMWKNVSPDDKLKDW